MAIYKCATLDPRNISAAQVANDLVFQNPDGVFGIEVTVPALAARCSLGNLDPQHGEQIGHQSAIEAALTCELPPDGTTIATIRADLDSIGAMVILVLRQRVQPDVEEYQKGVMEGRYSPASPLAAITNLSIMEGGQGQLDCSGSDGGRV